MQLAEGFGDVVGITCQLCLLERFVFDIYGNGSTIKIERVQKDCGRRKSLKKRGDKCHSCQSYLVETYSP